MAIGKKGVFLPFNSGGISGRISCFFKVFPYSFTDPFPLPFPFCEGDELGDLDGASEGDELGHVDGASDGQSTSKITVLHCACPTCPALSVAVTRTLYSRYLTHLSSYSEYWGTSDDKSPARLLTGAPPLTLHLYAF